MPSSVQEQQLLHAHTAHACHRSSPGHRAARWKGSAVQANGHKQVLQCPKSLLCLFNGTVGLDCAGHMEADVINKWNGVCLLPGCYSCCLFSHCLHEVLSLYQLLYDLGHIFGTLVLQPGQPEQLGYAPNTHHTIFLQQLGQAAATQPLQAR